MTNLELWGVNVDFKSYEKKWTIHAIIQNMSFYPPTENPCVMMRENLKTKCSEYIVVYQDDLCTTSPTPEAILNILQNKYKLNINQDFYLGAKYQIDPGGIMICELMKYLEKLYVNVTILINDNPPKHLKFSLKVMEIVITKGNLTFMPKETTDKHLNDLSRKRKAVDGNVNHCLATGRSLTGCLHFVNHTPIDSYSKRQATVKTATYSLLTIMKQNKLKTHSGVFSLNIFFSQRRLDI